MSGLNYGDQLIIYVIGIVTFLAVDALWLGKIAPSLYRKYIGHLMAKKPDLTAAAVFYTLYVIGLQIFVIVPALDKASLSHALGYGALFGLFTYATFDLTSQAVLKNWPKEISVIDISWGVSLCTLSSAIIYELAMHFVV